MAANRAKPHLPLVGIARDEGSRIVDQGFDFMQRNATGALFPIASESNLVMCTQRVTRKPMQIGGGRRPPHRHIARIRAGRSTRGPSGVAREGAGSASGQVERSKCLSSAGGMKRVRLA